MVEADALLVGVWMNDAAVGVLVPRLWQDGIQNGPRYDKQYMSQPIDFIINLHIHTYRNY